MVSEQQARACRHAFMTPTHPYKWGRLWGPLAVWTAFIALAIVGGALNLDSVPSILAFSN